MLSLTKDLDDGYIDQDGLHYDTPAEWLWIGILGGCGCGSAEHFAEESVRLLTDFATPMELRKNLAYDSEFYELLAHWIDSVGLIEHGTTVRGSWLTEKGKHVYEVIKEAIDA